MISPEQLAELWRRHASTLELFAESRCGEPEDCVQEAFIRLASEQPVPDEPVAWLYRVVRNSALNQARSARRRKEHERAIPFVPAQPVAPDAQLGWQQCCEQLSQALNKLGEEHQEIIIAHIWGGLTFRQLADLLGTSRASAHRRYQDALARLKNFAPELQLHYLEDCHG